MAFFQSEYAFIWQELYPLHTFTWNEEFSWLPRKCNVTGKRLWMCKCIKGEKMIPGPGSPELI